ncbi:MAG TPA: hypothetical protein VFQ51_09835 [Vicinamibacteria bacterium]|nr:hypothetical protein [Vicinamibacteria bacterium]
MRTLLRSLARLAGGESSLPRTAPSAVRSAVLEYGRTRFVKSYRAHVALEFERGLAIHRAAATSGAFRAPEPLALLEEHDLIVWEHLEGLVELREHLIRDLAERPQGREARAAHFERAGRALASIHEALDAAGPAPEHWPFRDVASGDARLDAAVAERLARSPLRPLHWDFVCGNLFLLRPDTLVVLDATPNWYLAPPGDDTRVRCPVYVDAATLVFSLWCHPRFSPGVASEVDACFEAFLSGYRAQAGLDLDRATVLACGARVAQVYQDFVDGRHADSGDHRDERRFRLDAVRGLWEKARASL